MRIVLFWELGEENICRDIDYFRGKLSVYDIRTIRGKMMNTFGKDAFSKGFIEFMDYYTLESYKVFTYKELSAMEGN